MPTPRPPRRRLWPIFALLAGFAGAPSARAQLGLPEAIAKAAALNADQLETIKRFVETNKVGLTAPESAAMRRARNALQEPLRVPGVSVEFRTRYTDVLDPVLKPLVKSPREEVVINALAIAGDLGTKPGVDLLDAGVADKRPAVRMMAVLCYKSVFNANAAPGAQPSLRPAQALVIIDTLRKVLDSEKDPMVLDGAAVSLDAATRVDPLKLEDVQPRAAQALAEGVGAVARRGAAGPALYGAGVHAGKTLFDLLSKPGVALPQNVLVACGGFAGDVLSSARIRLAAPPVEEPERSQLALLVAQAEHVYFLAHQRMEVGVPVNLNLADAIREGKDAAFAADAAKLIGPGGVLTQPPFKWAPPAGP